MVGPIVATTPPTTAQQADAKFFSKSQPVNERLFNQKADYDKILSETKFKLPADTVIAAGDWKLGLTLDSVGRLLKSFIGRDFSFGNRTESALASSWGPLPVSWLGSMSDTTSIQMSAKAVEEDGKLSLIFTANAWDSKIRTIVLRDGEQPEFIFNNGGKDTSDKGCVVQFSDVQKSGDDINLAVQLVKDFTAQGGVVMDEKNPLAYPPNFRLWGNVDVSVAQVQNGLYATVHDTLTARLVDMSSRPYTYSMQKLKNIVEVNIVDNYKYSKEVHEFFTRSVQGGNPPKVEVRGALFELGEKFVNGKLVSPKVYFKLGSNVPMAPDTNAYAHIPPGAGNQIAIFGPPSSDVDVFGCLNNQNERAALFAVKGGADLWEKGAGAVVFEISRPFEDTLASWHVTNSKLDSGKIFANGSYFVTQEKQGKEFLIGYNLRVRVIDNRHIVIEDISPEAMKGDKYYSPLLGMAPYERSSDTTDVPQPIARTSSLRVYPNPAGDQLTIEAVGDGRQMFVNLTDLYGRVVKNVYNGVPEGSGSFPLNTSDLPSGVYFLQVRGTNKSEAIKVEIIH